MRYLLSFLICIILGVSTLTAQVRKDRYEEPYPAPVSYANLSEKKAEFIALFEDRNVGNLHLFSAEKFKDNTPFKGMIISKNYKYFFPSTVWSSFRKKKLSPKALYSIRGDGEDWYIVRLSDKKKKNTLRLFEWNNKNLVEKMLLANKSCKGKKCEQLDSWLQDLDGNTTLDIIQRKVVTDAKGKVLSSVIKAYSIDDKGVFVENKNLEFDSSDYQIEKLAK